MVAVGLRHRVRDGEARGGGDWRGPREPLARLGRKTLAELGSEQDLSLLQRSPRL